MTEPRKRTVREWLPWFIVGLLAIGGFVVPIMQTITADHFPFVFRIRYEMNAEHAPSMNNASASSTFAASSSSRG